MSNTQYNIVFNTQWGSDFVPIGHPPQPHTGNMFLVTHNNNYDLFKLNSIASVGIINSSMFGTNDMLMDEIIDDENIDNIYTAPSINAPGYYQFTIYVNPSYPSISFVTMLAPSPDWFTGISSVNLLSRNHEWKKSIIANLWAYDAGSDYGNGFYNEPDFPVDVLRPISLITDGVLFPNNNPIPIAQLIIDKL